MNTRELIMKAMGVNKLSNGMLSIKSGVDIETIRKFARNDGSASIHDLETVLSSLGYQLTAVERCNG